MPNWNPNAPEALGLEWFTTHGQASRVFAGSYGRWQRIVSTGTETITTLLMSASVNPLENASIPTVVDIVVEGNEYTPLMSTAKLVPNADKTNDGWATGAGTTTNIYGAIDEDTSRWPAPAFITDVWIQSTTPWTAYACSVNASLFAPAGAAQNGRIGWVGVGALMSSNAFVYRKMQVALEIDGVLYRPGGGGVVDTHGFGESCEFFWGEINPSTGKPWLPADIADFGSAGNSRIWIRTQNSANTTYYPKVYALTLNVAYANTENRVAVGVYRRPEDIGTSGLVNVQTDSVTTLPGGAANWAKTASTNYLAQWRQSVSPSEYGSTVADDVRWNGIYQDLGPGGQPAGIVYPLTTSGTVPPAASTLASDGIVHDTFGRPERAFSGKERAIFAIGFVRSDALYSGDSLPYRLDLSDLGLIVTSGTSGRRGQHVVPATSQSYLGVRLPVIPPTTGTNTLTIGVYRVSDQVQMGGSFSITAAQCRALPKTTGGVRYVHGVLSSAASLVGSTAYEVRATINSSSTDPWIVFTPDCSLTAGVSSFGNNTSGAYIGATHTTTRDMAITLLRQPNPVTSPTAAITNVAVTTPYMVAHTKVTTVQHVNVSWVAPVSGLAGLFARYEIDRELDADGTWERVANVTNIATLTWVDHEVPRNTAARYRIRCIATDGRFSAYATTGSVTPAAPGNIVIFTSNHDPSLEQVYLYDKEHTYPFLSAERDEVVPIYGADYQVAFMESEDRGIGWRTNIVVNQVTAQTKSGVHTFAALKAIVRSTAIPYVCVLDAKGTAICGHVKVSEGTHEQPQHRYATAIDVTPTNTEPVPVTVT